METDAKHIRRYDRRIFSDIGKMAHQSTVMTPPFDADMPLQ